MHRADRIVVAILRQTFEHGFAARYFDEIKPEQLCDWRLRQRAIDDRFEKSDAVIANDLIERRDSDCPDNFVHDTLRLFGDCEKSTIVRFYQGGARELPS